jgi:O-antigen/teichoic acid export membrane protein
MSTAQTIAKNAFFLFLMRTIGFVLSFFLVMRVGRVLGSEGLGVYTLASTFLHVFVLIPNFGLDTLAIRDIARDRAAAGPYVANMVAAKAALALPAFVLLVGSILLLDYDPATRTAILVLAICLFFDPFAEAAAAIYQGFERMELMTVISGTSKILTTAVSLVLLERGHGVTTVLAVTTLGSAAVVPVHVVWVRRVVGAIPRRIDRDSIRRLLREAYPLFLTNLVGLLYFRTDVVMLSKMRDEHEVGLYGAAYSLLRALTMIPGIAVMAMYPALSRAYSGSEDVPADPASLQRLCDTAFKYQLALGIPLTVGLSAVAPETIDLLYGAEFEVSGRVLQLLIWSLLFFFTNTLLGYMLFTANRQRDFLGIKLVNLGLNVVLNAVLIPRYGLFGAAAATVATIAFSFLLHLRLVARFLYRVRFHVIAWRPALAAAAMAGVIGLVRGAGLPAMIPAGAATYAILLPILGFLTKDDLEIFRSILRRKRAAGGDRS